ncbi:MAG: cell division protein FtsZ [Bacteroidetes bacterium]|nr:cell division protein FtsZ [Bacteroidota bacterium]
MKFDLPKDQSSIIKVIGVGGGGSNAVNHMYNQGITGVDFVICNTDAQALALSPIPNKIQLGTTLTEGLGAGANPEVGKNAAIEDIENIKAILQNNTKMVFITAGMGGGTGTGAAPVIAEVARELGILTVGIVTIPFSFEGRRRKQQAEDGLNALRNHVDTMLIINNDKLRMIHGNLKMGECFSKADDILTTAAKGIAEIITVAGYINVDFEDVKTVMKDGGTAIMGSATAEGENRAIQAVTKALESPLLNDNEINGANFILLNVTSGEEEITMDEIDEITDYIQKQAGYTAELIWGNGTDESLGNKVCVTVIATGFGSTNKSSVDFGIKPEKIVHDLEATIAVVQSIIDDKVENNEENEEVEEPFLKTQTTQPSFEFDTNEIKTDLTLEDIESEKIIYNLEDEVEEDIVAEKEETTFTFELNESIEIEEEEEINDFSMEATNMEDEVKDSPFLMSDDKEEKKETIIWNLNDVINENEEASDNDDSYNISSASENVSTDLNEPVYTKRIPEEEQKKLSAERIRRIKELGGRMKTPSGISDLEKEPAYKRRQISLDSIPHSSENTLSRFTLSEDEDGTPKLKDDNSFLHDNVD